MQRSDNDRLIKVFRIMDVNALEMHRESGADHTLISKWVKGTRPLTERSTHLYLLVDAFLRMDTEGKLRPLYAPYQQEGESDAEAFRAYLLGSDIAGFTPTTGPIERQTSGSYTVQYGVYLGHKGFRKVALTMLDYLLTLPPGREVLVLCQGRYDWLTKDIPFTLQFINKLSRAVARGTRLTVINRRGYSIAETAAFAGPWLLAHLRGYIRSLYYDGDMPPDMRFAASIPGYWSGHAEEDFAVEDSLYVQVHSDPKDIQRDETLCKSYLMRSRPASQYGFFRNTQGAEGQRKLWKDGELPAWPGGYRPDGSIMAICRIPGFGLMTRLEFEAIIGDMERPPMPRYLLCESVAFASGPYRIILCREDVRDALAAERTRHAPLSALMHGDVYVPMEMITAQLGRLMIAMERRDDFQVALVPRAAFDKLEMELICWKDSVSVGWLQNMSESVFADDEATSGSFYGAVGYVWDKLLMSWRDSKKVHRLLRKWLDGRDLDGPERWQAAADKWDLLPKGSGDQKPADY